jgi:hypothetical protein
MAETALVFFFPPFSGGLSVRDDFFFFFSGIVSTETRSSHRSRRRVCVIFSVGHISLARCSKFGNQEACRAGRECARKIAALHLCVCPTWFKETGGCHSVRRSQVPTSIVIIVGISHLCLCTLQLWYNQWNYSQMFETLKNKSLEWTKISCDCTKYTKYKGQNLDVLSKDHPCA